ncbi:MAG TPA: MmcQ/YjbR family DNA-binding protein [Candidatus Acidoferrum sp.]|nr:MmcQ/YjbR family DNA-binding protein [Candidatus Acidoferrum sp.]
MPRSTINFDTVRKIGLALPGVEESTAYGQPALKIHGKLLACVPANRSAEPASLAVRVDFDDRAELLAADPDVYYVTDHYVGYTAVLVRLSRVSSDVLRDLLGMAYKFVTRNAAPRPRARKRRKPGPRK